MRSALIFLVLLAHGPALSAASSSCPAANERRDQGRLRIGSREFAFRERSIVDVTRTSAYCLGCHDGVVARQALPLSAGTAFASARFGPAEHPTDVPYPKMREGFRPVNEIDPRLKLRDGMVTCETCHGGADDAAFLLSIPNTRSALCLGCHVK